MKKSHSILPALRILLLTFFLGHYANITLFYHAHEIDGKMFCHSHFFGLGDGNNSTKKQIPLPYHSHSTEDFQLIQLYNDVCFTNDFSEPSVSCFEQKPTEIEITLSILPIISTFQQIVSLRAPPACWFFFLNNSDNKTISILIVNSLLSTYSPLFLLQHRHGALPYALLSGLRHCLRCKFIYRQSNCPKI